MKSRVLVRNSTSLALLCAVTLWATACTKKDTTKKGVTTCSPACEASADPCQESFCEGATCKLRPVEDGVACDDGDVCTANDACAAGKCVGPTAACDCVNDADCPDDGDPCNGTLYCDVSGDKPVCKTSPGTTIECPDSGDVCNPNVCDPKDGVCREQAAADGTICDDGVKCSTDDVCAAGKCAGKLAASCDCLSDADCASKEDGDACTGTLYCDKGGDTFTCKIDSKTVVVCPDSGNACTPNVCDPKDGSCGPEAVADGATCEADGFSCTQDSCKQGQCEAGDLTGACVCNTDADCAAFDNGNLCDGTLYCNKKTKTCLLNPASVVICSAKGATQCRQNLCDPKDGQCKWTNLPKKTACDDGYACTKGDACDGVGGCAAGQNTCQCGDSADCAKYASDNKCAAKLYCDKGKGLCKPNPATLPSCVSETDGTCLLNQCDPKDGQCKQLPTNEGKPCEADGNACTSIDRCKQGQCEAGPNLCPCQNDAECAAQDDGDKCNGTLFCNLSTKACELNPATVVKCPKGGTQCKPNLCDPKDGQCKLTAVPYGAPCDSDGFFCTQEQCKNGKCDAKGAKNICACWVDGDCQGGPNADLCLGALTCDNSEPTAPKCVTIAANKVTCPPGDPNKCTTPACNPATGKCDAVTLGSDGKTCDDDDVCTSGEKCAKGVCVGTFTAASICDDKIACTKDSCDPIKGCQHAPDNAICDDSVACTSDVCDAAKGCAQTPKDSLCDDGNACTKDACDATTGCKQEADCDDGLACTKDTCDKTLGCQSAPDDSACPDSNFCTNACVLGKGCVAQSNLGMAGKEICDGVDNDCNGKVDDTASACDLDNDGFCASNVAVGGNTCPKTTASGSLLLAGFPNPQLKQVLLPESQAAGARKQLEGSLPGVLGWHGGVNQWWLIVEPSAAVKGLYRLERMRYDGVPVASQPINKRPDAFVGVPSNPGNPYNYVVVARYGDFIRAQTFAFESTLWSSLQWKNAADLAVAPGRVYVSFSDSNKVVILHGATGALIASKVLGGATEKLVRLMPRYNPQLGIEAQPYFIRKLESGGKMVLEMHANLDGAGPVSPIVLGVEKAPLFAAELKNPQSNIVSHGGKLCYYAKVGQTYKIQCYRVADAYAAHGDDCQDAAANINPAASYDCGTVDTNCTNKYVCDDGNPCTPTGICEGVGKCVASPVAASCDDGNPCTKDSCDKGACKHVVLANSVSCGPESACGAPAVCQSGLCTAANNGNKTCDGGAGTCKGSVCECVDSSFYYHKGETSCFHCGCGVGTNVTEALSTTGQFDILSAFPDSPWTAIGIFSGGNRIGILNEAHSDVEASIAIREINESGTIGKMAFNNIMLSLLGTDLAASPNGAAAFTKGQAHPGELVLGLPLVQKNKITTSGNRVRVIEFGASASDPVVSKTIAWNTLVGGQINSSLKSLCSGGKTNGTIDKGEECEPTDTNPASYTAGACTNACRTHPGFGAAVALCGDFLLVGAPGLGKPVSSASEGAQLKGTQTFSVGGVWLVKRDDKGVWASSKDPLYRGGARLKKGEMNTPHVGLKGTFDCSGITAAIGDPSADQGEGVVRIYDMAGNYLTEKLKVKKGTFGQLGNTVAIEGDLLVAAAPQQDSSKGAVYVWRRSGPDALFSTYEAVELKGAGGLPANPPIFGASLAIAGGTIVVGQPILNTSTGPGQPGARVYRVSEALIPPYFTVKDVISTPMAVGEVLKPKYTKAVTYGYQVGFIGLNPYVTAKPVGVGTLGKGGHAMPDSVGTHQPGSTSGMGNTLYDFLFYPQAQSCDADGVCACRTGYGGDKCQASGY